MIGVLESASPFAAAAPFDLEGPQFVFGPDDQIDFGLIAAPPEEKLRLEETGAEYVGRMVMWIYFRKKTEDGPFDLFSDIDSKIDHLNKIGNVLSIIGGANLLIGIMNTFNPSHVGWINLLCATLLMYALGRIHGKKEALEKERLLHE